MRIKNLEPSSNIEDRRFPVVSKTAAPSYLRELAIKDVIARKEASKKRMDKIHKELSDYFQKFVSSRPPTPRPKPTPRSK